MDDDDNVHLLDDVELVTLNSDQVEVENNDNTSENSQGVSTVGLAIQAYFLVCGGPVGLEPLVKGGGPLWALCALLVFPVVWVIPQTLLTVELACMMPKNGGNIFWTKSAFGDAGGFINGWITMFTNVFDMALYPALAADYLHEMMGFSVLVRWTIIIAIVLFVALVNTKRFLHVGKVSGVLMVNVLLPFVVMFVMVLFGVGGNTMKVGRFSNRTPSVQWGTILHVAFWNMSGWDGLGNMGGEVLDPKRAYPRGALLACGAIVLTYLIPIMTGMSVSNEYSEWSDGYFVTIGTEVAPFLGYWVLVSSVASSVGIYNAQMATGCRLTYAMATMEYAPSFLTRVNEAGLPVSAIVMYMCTSLVLCTLSFEAILEIDNVLFGVSLLMEKCAFVVLKYTKPDEPRPFVVPGGKFGAWLITIPSTAIVLSTMALSTTFTLVVGSSVCCVVGIGYFVYNHFRERNHFVTVRRSLLLT